MRAERRKRSWLKRLIIGTALLLTICAAVFFFVLPPLVARLLNPTANKPPYTISPQAGNLHEQLFVADLHADSLLWNRDLLRRSADGHVDVPRLIEGNIALQAFTVVSKTPQNQNLTSNSADTDNIYLLALAQRQPLENLSSLLKRCLWQGRKLHEYAERSAGQLVLVKNKQDLRALIEHRRTGAKVVGGWLGIEGAQVLEGDVNNVDVLFDAGFRMMSPSHFFDTELGGSAHGVQKYGLTDKGREMIRRMETRGMLVDISHASEATINDVLSVAIKPVVVSHTGVRATCDNQRNLTDDQLHGVAKTGGVIGIGFWDTAVCGSDAKAIARAIRHTANVVGANHVALGSDFDGSIETAFDASGMALLTEALIAENFNQDEIRQIMGGNVQKLLLENLPEAE